MNEIRVKRMIREMQCDPVAGWFASLLGLSGSGEASPVRPSRPRAATAPGMPAAEGEALLLGGGIEK